MMNSTQQLHMVLASASPRRLHILQEHGLSAVVQPADIAEIRQPNEGAKEYVMRLAGEKAQTVLSQIAIENTDLLLAADTTVVYQHHILEKPRDADDAWRMLRMLSGQVHDVYTGYALVFLPAQQWCIDYVSTRITFHELTEQQIQDYIASGDPFDKAGAYGIQQVHASFVKEISGSYYNVMGLPIEEIIRQISLRGLR